MDQHRNQTVRERVFEIIFRHHTPASKRFDVALLWIILFSVMVVIIESIPEIHEQYFEVFYATELALTVLFTVEYVLRIWSSPRPLRYIFSFWGAIDLLSILPTYIDLFASGYHYLLTVRVFRLLRVFRILKLARFNKEAQTLFNAMQQSAHKIAVFMLAVVAIVVILGTLMYVIEGSTHGFTSIPQSIYWAIVTVTTVGFGDVVPHTVLGKMVSSVAMILGYAIIAVPTGILSAEMMRSKPAMSVCIECKSENPATARYCSRCGNRIEEQIS